MTRSGVLLAFVVALASLAGRPALLDAQVVQVVGVKMTGCAEPPVPIGTVNGSGMIAYRVLPNGRPDSSSIRILQTDGISPAGLRSAVVREYVRCRLDVEAAHVVVPVWLVQLIAFEGTRLRFTDGRLADSTAVMTAALPVTVPPDLDPTHTRAPSEIEEQPRALSCKMPSGAVPTNPAISAADRRQAEAERQREMQGYISAYFVVMPNGRVPSDSVYLELSGGNPLVKSRALKLFGSCRFAPGRTAGQPVPTRLHEAFWLPS